jgi:hypothetical protein
MGKFIQDILTEKDNVTFDMFRVLLCLGVVWFLCLSSYELVLHDHDFQLTEVSGGLTALLTFGGVALGYKSKSET